VYVQWFFEAGIVGVLAAAWLYLRIGKLLRHGIKGDRLGTFVVLSVIVEYLVVCYSDNMLDYLAFNWYFWFVVGTACAIAAQQQQEQQQERELSFADTQPAPFGGRLPPHVHARRSNAS
jgi:O-antigen ligase